MTLLDVAIAPAARSVPADQDDTATGVVIVEMKTAFMRAAQGALRANDGWTPGPDPNPAPHPHPDAHQRQKETPT